MAAGKLTPEIQDQICKYLRLGQYMASAADMAGIGHGTVANWMNRGAKEKERLERHVDRLEAYEERDTRGQPDPDEEQRRVDETKDQETIRLREASYVAFHTSVNRAISECQAADLATITTASRGAVIERKTVTNPRTGEVTTVEKRAPPAWQAAAWRLERRNPGQWAKSHKVELGSGAAETVRVTLADAVKAAHRARLSRDKEPREISGDVLDVKVVETKEEEGE